MKKLFLSIIVLGFLLSGNAYAFKKVKPGSGPLKFDDTMVNTFYIYLTEKFFREAFLETGLPGHHFGRMFCNVKPCISTYANYFLILSDDGVTIPYIFNWGAKGINRNPGGWNVQWSSELQALNAKIFAKKNKIVWKSAKKKISRNITLVELKHILKELDLYE